MATMYPQRLLDGVKSDAERDLYPRLARGLPDDYTVFHSVRWLAKSRAGGAYDGETDFLIVHPRHGVLIIEVKGGVIRRESATGRWTSTARSGVTYQIDPFGQAQRAFYSLRDKLRDSPLTRPYTYPLARGVWFPDVTLDDRQDLGLDMPREIILDASDLADPLAAVERLYDYWWRETPIGVAGARYGQAAVEALTRLLAPSIEIRTPLGAEFAREQEITRQLTEEQFTLLDFLSGMRRAGISGCAGSGKTFLAVEKARRLANQGYETLLTCYNRNLADWLRERLRDTPNVTVSTFSKLCEDFAQRAKLLPPPERRQGTDYFDRLLPEALLDATATLPDRFDAILVDEGQDFDAGWWVALEALLRDANDGIFYVFFDESQALYSRLKDVRELPVGGSIFPLTRNCRNTQEIHKVVAQHYHGARQIACQGAQGRAVEVLPVGKGKGADARVLRQVIHRLISDEHVPAGDIIMLTPVRGQSQWSEGQRLGNFTLTWGLYPSAPNAIACTTIHAFKGLERPVVIVTELEESHAEIGDELRYVAFSRATNHLIVLARDADVPASAP